MLRKTYNSLTQLKNELKREGKEKILEFDGASLITKKGRKTFVYGLYLGQISRREVTNE